MAKPLPSINADLLKELDRLLHQLELDLSALEDGMDDVIEDTNQINYAIRQIKKGE